MLHTCLKRDSCMECDQYRRTNRRMLLCFWFVQIHNMANISSTVMSAQHQAGQLFVDFAEMLLGHPSQLQFLLLGHQPLCPLETAYADACLQFPSLQPAASKSVSHICLNPFKTRWKHANMHAWRRPLSKCAIAANFCVCKKKHASQGFQERAVFASVYFAHQMQCSVCQSINTTSTSVT